MQPFVVLVDVIDERLDPLAFAFVTGSEDPANELFQHTRPRGTNRSLRCRPAPPRERTRGATIPRGLESGSRSTRCRSGASATREAHAARMPRDRSARRLASARPPWPVA